MAKSSKHDPAQLPAAAAEGSGGDGEAAARLLPLVYEELRKLAHRKMAQEPSGQTLQTTALVHEAYLRLFADKPIGWSGRGHFFAAAAEAMRRILVERAREQRTRKRGGGRRKLSLDVVEPFIDPEPQELLALNEALTQLENQDPRMSAVVKLRCFAGLTMDEIAQALQIAPRTVHREWKVAKAWLRAEIGKGNEDAQ